MLSSKKKSRQRSNGKRGKMTYLLRQTCEGWEGGVGGWVQKISLSSFINFSKDGVHL